MGALEPQGPPGQEVDTLDVRGMRMHMCFLVLVDVVINMLVDVRIRMRINVLRDALNAMLHARIL